MGFTRRFGIGAVGVATTAGLLFFPATAAKARALDRSERSCRSAISAASRGFLNKTLQVRQKCLQGIFQGEISVATDCVSGLGDSKLEQRLTKIRQRLSVVLPKKCVGVNLAFLDYPGSCLDTTGGAFDEADLELCVVDQVNKKITELLAYEYPPVTLLSSRADACVKKVGRQGANMVRNALRARQRCFLRRKSLTPLAEDLDCRGKIPPEGEGTRSGQTDRRIVGSYVALLSGIPQACGLLDVAALGYDDDCKDLTGGKFGIFDLRRCIFDTHRTAVSDMLELSFPSQPACGNARVEAGEECDDGNSDNTDNCLDSCMLARCGDGAVHAGVELCDDGNTSQEDACLNDCTPAACGDGFVHGGVEQCDDGNNVSGDGCAADCASEFCGDGVLQAGLDEQCDDGNASNTDSCLNDCTSAACGDSFVCNDSSSCESGPGGGVEECDDGAANSDTATDACRSDCSSADCGDGVLDSGEACDDGNANDKDACLSSCALNTCGDGFQNCGADGVCANADDVEGCDDGNNVSGDGCAADCRSEACGDGVVQPSEECDDGAANSDTTPDACRSDCRNAHCGDGVMDSGEVCDDGNAANNDSCLNSCVAASCGDSFVETGIEQCDDGNNLSGDGCTADCVTEFCGDGVVQAGLGEECDDGAANSDSTADACRTDCMNPRCGDGVTDSSEECDNGVANSDTTPDACRSDCRSAGCGDGVLDSGEQCDGDMAAACVADDTVCGSTCQCANECPAVGELVLFAGVGEPCTTDADCGPGSCQGGFCRTVTKLDTGVSGIAHDADITDRVVTRGFLDCGKTFPCGLCNLAGIDPSQGNCRCANDNQAVCDQPFQPDADDCDGDICNCYFGPPLSLSSGNTPACVVNRFARDISGTADVDLGAGEIEAHLRSQVFLGLTLIEPCPFCMGDVTANDGVRDGTCVDGPNNGQACDANGSSSTFPAPQGGAASIDCFPPLGKNVSGQGLQIDLIQGTDRSELLGTLTCGFPFFGINECQCRQCSGDTTIPCSSDADCSATSAGSCNSLGSGTNAGPNSCSDGVCQDVDGKGITGACKSGPDDPFCDGVVRANGEGFIGCSTQRKCTQAPNPACGTNADCGAEATCEFLDCKPGAIGIDAGDCTLVKRRPCFLNPIVAEGKPDPDAPVGAATFCIPPTGNAGINGVAGLPGPGRVVNQAQSTLFCASDLTKTYTPGVGGCP